MCKNLLNWHRELPVSDRSIRSQFCQSQAADKSVCGASNLNSNCRLKQQMLRPESPYPSIIPDRYSTRFLCSKPLPLFSVNRHSWQNYDILAYLVWTFSTMKDVLRNRDNGYVQSSISWIRLKSLIQLHTWYELSQCREFAGLADKVSCINPTTNDSQRFMTEDIVVCSHHN